MVNLGNAQTQIQLPTGYGLNGSNGFVTNVAMPFFSNDGFVYCKAHLYSNSSGFPGAIFKVDEKTNVVTELTGIPIAFENIDTHSFQVYNGEIFCSLGSSYQVLRINPTLNTYIKIDGIGGEYAILNNKIFGGNRAYHLTTGTFSDLMDPENPTEILPTLQGYKFYNNSIFCTRTITNFVYGTPQYTSKSYRIFDATVIVLLYTNSFNGIYEGFDDGKPVVFNNKVINRYRKFTNDVATIYVESYDLDTNSLNTIFTYEPINIQNSHYVFNNNIYFNNSIDQTLISNGINQAVVSDIPNIFNSSFSYDINSPVYGGSTVPTIQNNNNVFGCKVVQDTTTNTNIYTVRKSNGSLSGTSTIYTSSNGSLNSAIIVNNYLYFFKYTELGGFGELLRYNETNNQVTNPISFFLNSLLFGVNDSIFFYGVINNVYGLYKLDKTTLSIVENKILPRTTFSPNPTTAQIDFSEEINNLEAFDITGKKVKSFQKPSISFDVSNLEKGFFIINGKTAEGKTINHKLVKE